jgi:hypothetical protein
MLLPPTATSNFWAKLALDKVTRAAQAQAKRAATRRIGFKESSAMIFIFLSIMHERLGSQEARRTIYMTLRFEKHMAEVRLQIAKGNPRIVKTWVHFCNITSAICNFRA